MTCSQEPYKKALLTDLYQLTMVASYFDHNKMDEVATFEMFIRSLPQDWGYFIAAGIDEAVDYVCQLQFTDEDISYLQVLNLFKPEYLDYLRDFKFKGNITTIREGTPFTSETPIIRVTAKRPQAQLIETILLNLVNFQTMISSKASRIVNAAGKATVIDFGLRRAHGSDAGIKGARSTYIAGVGATSNVEAAKIYDIPPSGTMAHSFVMGFSDEIDSFRAFAHTFPNNTVLLIDTYDTLEGARKAATVAMEMEKEGHRLLGVRLDSGEMESLAEQVREILDDSGLDYVRIVLSSDLNEYKIEKYTRVNTPVDFYGVGTEMITAKPVAALSGVYKLVEDTLGPRIKLSESKRTYPGRKQVYRVMDEDGVFLFDVLEFEGEYYEGIPLLEQVVKDGKRTRDAVPLKAVREYCLSCVERLPEGVKKVRVTEPYQLKIGPELMSLTERLFAQYSGSGE
ncbi:nicotinate phosphoribosyltransferase [Thermoproteota archaeon]